jgi:uncharacterized protein (TIGR02217 family)
MNYHDISLPKFIEVFVVGRFEFAASYVSTLSGREIIKLDREDAKQKYLIKNCRLSQAEFEQFNNFFRARRGRQFAFRFRDYSDYQVNKQLIAKGDGRLLECQLFKLYEDPITPYIRIIRKPVKDTIKLYINDQEAEGAIINYNTGIIKLNSPLLSDQILVADFIFDVVVRFNNDSFEYMYRKDGSIELSTIELVEVV